MAVHYEGLSERGYYIASHICQQIDSVHPMPEGNTGENDMSEIHTQAKAPGIIADVVLSVFYSAFVILLLFTFFLSVL